MGAPRQMTESEIVSVMSADVVGHLASIDGAGYPHVTPLWFHWDGEVARMTSAPGRPHLQRLAMNLVPAWSSTSRTTRTGTGNARTVRCGWSVTSN